MRGMSKEFVEGYHPTPKQQFVYRESIASARATARQLISIARAARDTVVQLPHRNEDGTPVLHGANYRMSQFSKDLMAAFWSMRLAIGRDYHDMLQYEYRVAAMGYPARFHSEDEWHENAQHLIAEHTRLCLKVLEGVDDL